VTEPYDQTVPAPLPSPNRGTLGGSGAAQPIGMLVRRGFWPLVDQAVVSLGNFVTLVLVARGLPDRSEYGVFGLILEVIFYLNTLQGSLIIFPLTLRGATSDDHGVRRLATASMLMTLLVSLPVALAALVTTTALHGPLLGIAGAAALLSWQLQDVTRNALRARFRFAASVVGDAIRYLGTAATMWILWRNGRITLPAVFAVIAACSALAIVVQAIQVGLARVTLNDFVLLVREFWNAGRWLLFSSASAIVVSICGVWALSWSHGNTPVGEFYAIANFTKPVNPIIVTFAALVTQYSAKAVADHGVHAAKAVALRLSAGALSLMLPYLLAVISLPGLSLRLLYGTESHFRTPDSELALRIFTIGFIMYILMSMIGSFLNGIGRSRDAFHAQIINAIATIVIALPLTITHGLLGQIIGGAIAAAVQCSAMIYYFRRAGR